MKKLLAVFLIGAFTLMSLVACGSPSPSEPASTTPPPPPARADITDIDALYEFVKAEIFDTTRQNFDTWEIHYLDITGDGNEEAVLISTYGAEWHNSLEIVSDESGEFKVIPNDLYLGKYGNSVSLQDGFLVLNVTTGGSGVQDTYMNLAVYDGSKMATVLSDLLMEASVAIDPENPYDLVAELDGKDLSENFVYILHRWESGQWTIETGEMYIYDSATQSFTVEPAFVWDPSGSAPSGPSGSSDSSGSSGTFGWAAEVYNDQWIIYEELRAAIIPMYTGIHLHDLTYEEMLLGYDGPWVFEVAVFGELQNAAVTLYEGKESFDFAHAELGTISNTVLAIWTDFESEFSRVELTGKVGNEEITVVLDHAVAAGENTEPILVYYAMGPN